MGRHDIRRGASAETIRAFSRAVIRDLEALEALLAKGAVESGIRRIGAEQELFITDAGWNPLPIANRLLEDLADPRFTTEIAQFNLEVNMPPLETGPDVLQRFRTGLEDAVRSAAEAARRRRAHVVLAGILPTLTKSHLSLDNITPAERYYALNDAVMKLAGGHIRLMLQGIDEIRLEHDSVMLESCNTSFQVHLQVDPDSFAAQYNTAQAVCGPVLAAAVNSPLLFSKRLWKETRIGLFRQAVDGRQAQAWPRDSLPRVWFGDAWVRDSIVEVFRENILRYRLLVAADTGDDPLEVIDAGAIPRLDALQLHNGTIYRWNRPCFGVADGTAHVRIECRALPAGPTVVDEVANAAFWIGLVSNVAAFGDVSQRMKFDDAHANFIAAARLGLDTSFNWLDGERLGASQLIRDRLLPVARDGLLSLDIAPADIDEYLGIIDRRVESGNTGARWLLRSDLALRDSCPRAERMAALTALSSANASAGRPVHEWPIAAPGDLADVRACYDCVEHCMTTDLLTVREDDAVDLATFIMNQRGVRQILVEDDDGRLAGIISYRSLLRLLATGRIRGLDGNLPVREIMTREFITVTPDTPTVEAIRIMREKNVTALAVVRNDHLVGIVSEHDFLPIVASLLHDRAIPMDS
jgi:CBS domain-containing protein